MELLHCRMAVQEVNGMNKEGYKDPTAEEAIANVQKHWRDVTRAERVKQKKERCRFCRYALKADKGGDNVDNITCNYIERTGHSRGCSPIGCTKFTRNSRKKRGVR